MEDITKILEQNEPDLLSSSDENSSHTVPLPVWHLINNEDFQESEIVEEIKYSSSVIARKRNGEKRLPTRRPDPNVCNRNALLARENRRKKKAYIQMVEKKLQLAKRINLALVEALKRQIRLTQRLEKENKYYENLVANRSDIFTIVNAFNYRIPEHEKLLFSSTSNSENYINDNMGDKKSDRIFSSADALSIEIDTLAHDVDSGTDNTLTTLSTNWGDKDSNIDKVVQSFDSDHCYVSASALHTTERKPNSINYAEVTGESLHIEKVYSRTPPLQLLSENLS